MQIVERRRPHALIYLESLLARTPSHHPSYPDLKEKLRRRSAGFAGECWFDRVWLDYETTEPFKVISDLQLPLHQIDSLCIFPSFILIVEIKNISGLIQMDGNSRQFARTLNGETIGMANPDDQLYRHEKRIRQLTGNKIPVIGIVVFTNPNCVLQINNIDRRIIHFSGFPYILDSLIAQYREFPKFNIQENVDLFLSLQLLQKVHEPDLISSQLATGIFCSLCAFVKMHYSKGLWRCPTCSLKDPHAHLVAMQDYRLLINNTISNREFRQFTGLSSRTNATKLLQSSGFQTIGSHKSLRYVIPEIDWRGGSGL